MALRPIDETATVEVEGRSIVGPIRGLEEVVSLVDDAVISGGNHNRFEGAAHGGRGFGEGVEFSVGKCGRERNPKIR